MSRHHAFSRSSSSLFLLGTIGALLGPVILLFGYPFPPGSQSQIFFEQPNFLLVLFLVAVYSAISTLLIFPVWSSMQMLRKYTKHHQIETVFVVAAIMLLFAAPTLLAKIIPIPFQASAAVDPEYLGLKFILLIILGSFAGIPMAFGTLMIPNLASLELSPNPISPSDQSRQIDLIKQYLTYLKIIRFYLYSSGTLVGLIVLIAGSLRNVRLAVGLPEDQYPQSVLIAFGLYWSAILALFYAIGYLSLLECGRNLRDHIQPLNSTSSLSEDVETRKLLDELLQLNNGLFKILLEASPIATPLLAGLVSHLLRITP
jgi:hypothetical protein